MAAITRGRLVGLTAPAARALAGAAIVLAGLLAGIGWLYLLRENGWLALGPRVADSLPLLQLAGFDGQPLVRVVAAWLLAGVIAGFGLVAVPRLRRASRAGLAALMLLALTSQAAYALARNLRLTDILFTRTPGLGPLVEALAFAAGCALPGALSGAAPPGALSGTERQRALCGPVVGAIAVLRDRRLGGGERRQAPEDHHDREPMGDDRHRASA